MFKDFFGNSGSGMVGGAAGRPPAARARARLRCPAHRIAPRTPSLTAYMAFGRSHGSAEGEQNESPQDQHFCWDDQPEDT